jgi:hypothetical protein
MHAFAHRPGARHQRPSARARDFTMRTTSSPSLAIRHSSVVSFSLRPKSGMLKKPTARKASALRWGAEALRIFSARAEPRGASGGHLKRKEAQTTPLEAETEEKLSKRLKITQGFAGSRSRVPVDDHDRSSNSSDLRPLVPAEVSRFATSI